ncbi:hypothetical protein BH24BAC1_BH24BAC1_14920 [soil metagenome]
MKKANRKKWMVVALMFGAGLAAGLLAGKLGVRPTPYPADAVLVPKGQALLVVVASIGVAGFLGVLLHELGHLAGGLLARLQFWAIIVGAFRLSRSRNRLRFGLNRTLSQALGLVMFRFPDTHRLRPRMLLLVAGGPLASGLAAVLGFGLLYGTGLSAHLTREASLAPFSLALLVQVFAWVNALLFVVSAIPAEAGGFYTDGARLFNFLRGGRKPNLDVAFTEAYVALTAGTRPRDFALQVWEDLLAHPQESLYKVYARLYAYYTCLDQGNPGRARGYLEQVLQDRQRINPFSRPAILFEAAYFYAAHLQDPTRAQAFLSPA